MRNAQRLRNQMTAREMEAMARLHELENLTGEIEEEAYVVLQRCRNFLGYVAMSLHDGSFRHAADWFVDDTNGELDQLVAADPKWAAYAADYRATRTSCVAAYKRVLDTEAS